MSKNCEIFFANIWTPKEPRSTLGAKVFQKNGFLTHPSFYAYQDFLSASRFHIPGRYVFQTLTTSLIINSAQVVCFADRDIYILLIKGIFL